MKILKRVLVGGVIAVAASHPAKADDAEEIRVLKAELKKLRSSSTACGRC
jgi:hypothetical protein